MSTDFAWYENDDVTPNATLSYNPTNGTPSGATERHLHNDFDASGDDDSEDFLITVLSRPSGVGDYTMTDELAAGGYVEGRLIGSGGTGIVNQTSPWTPLGRGRYLRVKGIPAECFREFEFRANVPLGVGMLAKDFKVRIIEGARAINLELGHYEGGAHGLRMGLGDATFSELLYGFDMTEDATPDATVHVSAGIKVIEGVPSARTEEILTFTDLDVNSAALAAGEEYLALVTVDETGAATQTKSAKGTAPVNEANLPAVPDGHKAIGWVQVPFGLVINTAEIHQDNRVYGGAKLEGTGLSPTISPFEGLIGNSIVLVPSPVTLTLVDDDVNYVFISPTGSVTVNVTGIQPESLSQLAYEVTVAAGVITSIVDCRAWVYPNPLEVEIKVDGTLTTSSEGFGVLACGQSAYLLPLGGVAFSVGSPGTTSGANTIDILAADRAGAFTTIFTGGTEVPSIAYDATHPVDFDSIPKVMFFHGYTRFQVDFTAVAGAGTPKAATVVLRMSGVGSA